LVLACGLVAQGCETAASETRPTPGPGSAEPPKVKEYDVRKLARSMRTVDALIQRGDTRRKDEFVTLQVVDPSAPADRFLLAYKLTDRRDAWKELDALRKQLPGNPLGYLGILTVYVEWKLDDEALRSYDAALKLDPDLPVAHARMGNLSLARGNTAAAEQYYSKALAQDPEDGDALYGQVHIARAAGRTEDALALLERTLKAWPESLTAARERGELLEELGRRKDAARALQHAATLDARPYEALMRAAALMAQEGDRAAAEEIYREALVHNPKDPGLLATLGQLAGERGDTEAQRSFFARAVEGKPDDLDIQRMLALSYLEKGETAGAERHFLEVVRLKPDDQAAHLALARMYLAMPRMREAMEHFDLAALAGPLDETAASERSSLATTLMLPKAAASGGNVNAVFNNALKSIVTAYQSRLKSVPQLRGSVTVEIDVDADGAVTSTRLKDDTLQDDILLANIYFTIKNAQFPKGKKARYNYPISFSGAGPAKGK